VPRAPRGRQQSVPDEDVITDNVVEYCEMLRAWKIPVFCSTVIGHFQMLLGDSPLGSEFKLASGSWDYTKLGYWYKRRFLGDNVDISAGLPPPGTRFLPKATKQLRAATTRAARWTWAAATGLDSTWPVLHNLDKVKYINASFFKQSVRQLEACQCKSSR